MQGKVKALRRKSRNRSWNLHKRKRAQLIFKEEEPTTEVIIPASVDWKVNSEGEEYAVVRTPDGALYTVRNNVIFDQDGFDRGKASVDWLEALLLKK